MTIHNFRQKVGSFQLKRILFWSYFEYFRVKNNLFFTCGKSSYSPESSITNLWASSSILLSKIFPIGSLGHYKYWNVLSPYNHLPTDLPELKWPLCGGCCLLTAGLTRHVNRATWDRRTKLVLMSGPFGDFRTHILNFSSTKKKRAVESWLSNILTSVVGLLWRDIGPEHSLRDY